MAAWFQRYNRTENRNKNNLLFTAVHDARQPASFRATCRRAAPPASHYRQRRSAWMNEQPTQFALLSLAGTSSRGDYEARLR